MKKIFLLVILLFFTSLSVVDAKWYGSKYVSYTNTTPSSNSETSHNSTGTNCPLDGDTMGGTPFWSNPVTGGRYYDSAVSKRIGDQPANGQMYCWMWDASAPEITNFMHHEGWTNDLTQNITVRVKEGGGSGIKIMYGKRNKYGSYVSVYSNSTLHNLKYGNSRNLSYVYTGINGEKYKPRVGVFDHANNSSTYTYSNKDFIYFDTTPIDADDFGIGELETINGGTTNENGHRINSENIMVMADKNKKLYVKLDRGTWSTPGSGAQKIEGTFDGQPLLYEHGSANNSTRYTLIPDASCGSDGLEYTHQDECFYIHDNSKPSGYGVDIHEVDSHPLRNNNGFTDYILSIKEVEDIAGNVTTGINKNLNYHVYANIPSSLNTDYGDFTDPSNPNVIADGSEHAITFTPKDQWDNVIVPVRFNSINIRRINFRFTYQNGVHLNQYRETGRAVQVKKIGSSVWSWLSNGNRYINQISRSPGDNRTGIYSLGFKFYAPTYRNGATDGRQYIRTTSLFDFIQPRITIRDYAYSANNKTITGSNGHLQAKPIYHAEIVGSIRDNGLIAGSQESDIRVHRNGMSEKIGTRIITEFGTGSNIDSTKDSVPEYDLAYGAGNSVINGPISFLTGGIVKSSNIAFNTELTQNVKVDRDIPIYLATHVKIPFAGIGTSYYSSFTYGTVDFNYYNPLDNTDEGRQRVVKILGTAFSNNLQDSTTDTSAYKIDRTYNKAVLEKQIRKNVAEFERSGKILQMDSIDSTTVRNDLDLETNGVIYVEPLSYDYVHINLSTFDTDKDMTFIIKGGDFYITKDILNAGKGTLGIIALKDNDGKGGNVYIKQNVEQIKAIIYAQDGIKSGEEASGVIKHLTPNNGGTYSKLNKQLYIKGSVFSNNTIGGSLDPTNPICPFYIADTDCDLDLSRGYDLNYLRRAKDANKNTPAYRSNHGNEPYSTIIEYDPKIVTSTPPLFEFSN